MEYREYLVGFGKLGGFGRFRPCYPLACDRGARVVVRTSSGLEMGTVLSDTRPGHARFLPNTSVGELVRQANARDEETFARMESQAGGLLASAAGLAEDLGLGLALLDAEVLLDGRHARLHYLSAAACDPRPLLDALADRHHLFVTLHNLNAELAEDSHGCGAEGCGHGDGGCGSCATSGCASCGSHSVPAVEAPRAGRVALY